MSEDQGITPASTRREFLRTAAVTAAATAAASGVAKSSVYSLAPGRVIGANDRVNIGFVGVGGQGFGAHLSKLKDAQDNEKANPPADKADAWNIDCISACDIYGRRVSAAKQKLGAPDSRMFMDYRKFMEQKDIDAVWVATSDNWHAAVAIAALEAGKHVYVEKPMCRTIEEAFQLYDAVKKSGRLLQVGSQGCSDQKWHVARKVVKDGRIGKAIQAQGSYCRNGTAGEWNYYHIDEDAGPTATGEAYVNWEMFRKGLGPKEWDPDRYFRWRKWWEYGNGIMGDLFPHRLHPLAIALNLPTEGVAGFPIRAASLGGIYVQKINPVTKKKDRDVPDFTNLCIDFAEECSLMLLGSTINEQGWQDMIRGNKATLFFGGGGVEIRPERVYAEEIEGGTEPVEGPGEDIPTHHRNFLDGIRKGTPLNCGIDLAVRVQVMISLGEMAYRRGKTMHFDPKTRKYWG
jgi:predicted dehydrogenase